MPNQIGTAGITKHSCNAAFDQARKNKLNLPAFRLSLLARINQAKLRQPGAHIHLVYAPEVSDSLDLVSDARRDVALIRGARDWPEENVPRLVTLDCRRVAGYLLEFDPGIDDPLLESSISLAHADTFHMQADRSLLMNEDPGLAQSAVCGWIVSSESATRLASRIGSLSSLHDAKTRRRLLRWYDPEFMIALWPTLSSAQQHAVMGNADWISCNANKGVLHFKADRQIAPEDPSDQSVHRRLSAVQWQTVDNVAIVSALMLNWKAMSDEQGDLLPDDATQQLHQHVRTGQKHGLDADDLVIYTMTAVQLPPGATQAPEFAEMLSKAAAERVPLRDALQQLPDGFWQRYQPIIQQSQT